MNCGFVGAFDEDNTNMFKSMLLEFKVSVTAACFDSLAVFACDICPLPVWHYLLVVWRSSLVVSACSLADFAAGV